MGRVFLYVLALPFLLFLAALYLLLLIFKKGKIRNSIGLLLCALIGVVAFVFTVTIMDSGISHSNEFNSFWDRACGFDYRFEHWIPEENSIYKTIIIAPHDVFVIHYDLVKIKSDLPQYADLLEKAKTFSNRQKMSGDDFYYHGQSEYDGCAYAGRNSSSSSEFLDQLIKRNTLVFNDLNTGLKMHLLDTAHSESDRFFDFVYAVILSLLLFVLLVLGLHFRIWKK